MTLAILYEDNHLIAVDKPRGMPTQSDKSGDADLLTLVKDYLKERYRKPGAVYLGLVHRLDRPVGGVVLFAKTSKAAARLADAWRRGAVKKVYLAVVKSAPAPLTGELEHWVWKDTERNVVSVVPAHTPGAKRAALRYRTLETIDGCSLLSVALQTGRSHQIRVQLAAIGHPVVGDEKYGPKSGAAFSELALHAAVLALEHPVRREPLVLCVPPPDLSPWDRFPVARQVDRSLIS